MTDCLGQGGSKFVARRDGTRDRQSRTLRDMKSSGVSRVGAIFGPVVAGALLLGACGGSSDSGATRTTIDLSQASTAFVVRPPATTVPGLEEVAVGGIATGEQEYVVQAGDYPLKIVNDFNVTLDDLLAYNEWASVNEFPGIGETILIPPGATVAIAATDATGDAAVIVADGDGEGDVDVTVVTIPDAGDNCAEGKYTVADGDFEQRVADKFDVTLDALRAANNGTSNYSAFFPGLEIKIPAKADC